MDLLKIINSLNWYIILFSLINLSVCIYEDQVGKFDWRQTYVGRIKFAQFDTVSTAKKIIVATEENVLAALHLKTGQVVWRHVFESASSGNIQLLHVSDKVLTVSGCNPYLVRGWDSATGVLLWEWSLALNTETPEFSEFLVHNGLLIHVLPVMASHIEVTTYNMMTGQNRGSTSKLPALWVNEGCLLSKSYYICISGAMGSQLLISTDVTSDAVQIISKPVSQLLDPDTFEGILRQLDGNNLVPGVIVDDKKVVLIMNHEYKPLKVTPVLQSSITIIDSHTGPLLLQSWHDEIMGLAVTAFSITYDKEVSEIHSFDRTVELPEPEISAAMCTKTAREQYVCRLLLTGADDASLLLQQGGRVLWRREEALANVIASEFVDLPVSDLEAAIESEFDQKQGSIWSAFSRRLSTQLQQLQTLLYSYTHHIEAENEPSKLVRDYFNLHKIIVLVTDVGKIFGMDNLSGEILWQRYVSYLDTESVLVFTRRTARHPPLDACVTVVGKHVDSGNGILVSFNPITGALVGERILILDNRLLQAAILHKVDNEKTHAILLLDVDENVLVFPRSAARLVQDMYMYVAEPETSKLQGYALKYDGSEVIASRTWSVHLGGRLAAVAGARGERSQSPGRVLPDRGVLYNHLNPNLVLFVAHKQDQVHKDVVVASCVDVVSGAVVAAQAHRRARPTPHAVLSENFMAYVYYNDKHRRTEIATIELFEGMTRWLEPGAAFSSWGSGNRAPAIGSHAYILPAAPTAAALTRTERSITDRHLLLGLTTGAIVELPWSMLETRWGPGGVPGAGGAGGMEAVAPELPLAADAVANYNRSVARLNRLAPAPAGLESTCLLLATGLDIFYTRVVPSKTFDLLNDDYDYYLITLVLAALVVTTYSTRYFASRKMLRMAWK